MTSDEPVISRFPHRLTVDGELWEIRRDKRGQFHYGWLSGLAAGSGFTSCFNVPLDGLPLRFCEESIRDYMAEINPETGYLD